VYKFVYLYPVGLRRVRDRGANPKGVYGGLGRKIGIVKIWREAPHLHPPARKKIGFKPSLGCLGFWS